MMNLYSKATLTPIPHQMTKTDQITKANNKKQEK